MGHIVVIWRLTISRTKSDRITQLFPSQRVVGTHLLEHQRYTWQSKVIYDITSHNDVSHNSRNSHGTHMASEEDNCRGRPPNIPALPLPTLTGFHDNQDQTARRECGNPGVEGPGPGGLRAPLRVISSLLHVARGRRATSYHTRHCREWVCYQF